MTNERGGRVHFYPGQFLRAQDFSDEQLYHLELHRRHNISQHDWGIAAGLELSVDPDGPTLYLEPGVAVDGFGRVLVLSDRRAIAATVFAEHGSDQLDVYLNYRRAAGDPAPQGYTGCGDAGQDTFYRWLERPYLSFELADPTIDRRCPPGLADTDGPPTKSSTPASRGVAAARTLPDSPARRWPVFLGAISLDRANRQQPYSTDPTGRPYAGLVGELIVAPSGGARVQIGAEQPDDPHRFAVFVPGDAASPRLAIDTNDTLTVAGNTTLHGNLTIDAHALVLGAGEARAGGKAPAQLYHVATKNEQDVLEHEMRVELAAPGGQGPQRLAIGTWLNDSFKPCLTVDHDCTITVHGDLVVQGKLDTQALADPSAAFVDLGLSDEARRLALSAFQRGVTGAAVELPQVYKSPFPTPEQAILAQGPEQTLQAAAMTVSLFADRVTAFAAALRGLNPQAADALRQALVGHAEGDNPPGDAGSSDQPGSEGQ